MLSLIALKRSLIFQAPRGQTVLFGYPAGVAPVIVTVSPEPIPQEGTSVVLPFSSSMTFVSTSVESRSESSAEKTAGYCVVLGVDAELLALVLFEVLLLLLLLVLFEVLLLVLTEVLAEVLAVVLSLVLLLVVTPPG